MSAFLVGKPHLNALVALALFGPSEGRRWSPLSWYAVPVDVTTSIATAQGAYRKARGEDADQIGQMLAEANARSIAARYGADAEELDEDYVRHYHVPLAHLHLTRRPSAVEGLKCCACFRYQACEDRGWEQSEAARFIDALEHALISALPGYDQANGWEWRG